MGQTKRKSLLPPKEAEGGIKAQTEITAMYFTHFW
jgi:hypothetical protein